MLSAIVQDYRYARLDMLLRTAYPGKKASSFGSAEGNPADLAMAVLDDASSSGYADRLLRVMLKQQDCTPELRNVALDAFPNLEYVATPFDQLIDKAVVVLTKHRAALSAKDGVKPDADKLLRQLPLLAGAKSLHAALHRVQAAERPDLPDPQTGAGTDEFFFIVHLNADYVRSGVAAARKAVLTQPVLEDRDGLTLWVALFEGYAERLAAAEKAEDVRAASRTLGEINLMVDPLLTLMNFFLKDRAAKLPFQSLIAVIKGANETDATILAATRDEITARIDEHDGWQEVDRDFLGLGGALRGPPREAFKSFLGSWRESQPRITALMMSTGPEWASKASGAIAAVDLNLDSLERYLEPSKMPEENIVRVTLTGPFNTLRSAWRQRFLSINMILKDQLAVAAMKLEQPLSQI